VQSICVSPWETVCPGEERRLLKNPLPSAVVDSSESPKRFSLSIALQILDCLVALFQWWFLVLAHLATLPCFEGSFRAQLVWDNKLPPALQGRGDLDRLFQKRLRELRAQIKAAYEKPTGTD